MGSLEALIAIALLCQVPGTKLGQVHHAAAHQLKCQKEYILCIEKGLMKDQKNWVGPLKECVLKKPLDAK